MEWTTVGEICALITALVWACATVLFRLSGHHIPPLALNLFKNSIGLILLILTLLVGGEASQSISQLSIRDWWILSISGIIGIAVADTLFFLGLNRIGVGIMSIVECTYSPMVILCSWLMLDERLKTWQYWGAGLILLAVLISTKHPLPAHQSRSHILQGILLGALSMGLMAYGIVLAKPTLANISLPLATSIRMTAGSLALAVFALCHPNRRIIWNVFRPNPGWKSAIPAAILGAYLSMMLWVAGFKYAPAGIAGLLNQTSSIWAMTLAALVLKEKFSARKAFSLLLAMAGIIIISVNQLP